MGMGRMVLHANGPSGERPFVLVISDGSVDDEVAPHDGVGTDVRPVARTHS